MRKSTAPHARGQLRAEGEWRVIDRNGVVIGRYHTRRAALDAVNAKLRGAA
jgi:hypothetical protein